MAFARPGQGQKPNSGKERRNLRAWPQNGDGDSVQVVIGIVVFGRDTATTAWRLQQAGNIGRKCVGGDGRGLYCCAQQYCLKD
ncbi:hypothetical protein SAMN04487965_2789 [Microbulbifer donghaiensis]|uniref:Uncharacterized protein n=1 Tax=Microbulbifer donghaiensis TaxID=494016 RepID=A0A1M5F413_9GAMM|nr:hypothetical protein [Microbulbifer donghaiensis]SHF86254.1 hypothetical protein SAMN04487965_2789 [Microbulbifer donghaiensis]